MSDVGVEVSDTLRFADEESGAPPLFIDVYSDEINWRFESVADAVAVQGDDRRQDWVMTVGGRELRATPTHSNVESRLAVDYDSDGGVFTHWALLRLYPLDAANRSSVAKTVALPKADSAQLDNPRISTTVDFEQGLGITRIDVNLSFGAEEKFDGMGSFVYRRGNDGGLVLSQIDYRDLDVGDLKLLRDVGIPTEISQEKGIELAMALVDIGDIEPTLPEGFGRSS